MSAKLNDVLDVNLHVIPKIANAIPSQEIDVSQLRHIHNLQLADPQFNVPGKIDILLGADFLDDVMLDNRTKDNGLQLKSLCLVGLCLVPSTLMLQSPSVQIT